MFPVYACFCALFFFNECLCCNDSDMCADMNALLVCFMLKCICMQVGRYIQQSLELQWWVMSMMLSSIVTVLVLVSSGMNKAMRCRFCSISKSHFLDLWPTKFVRAEFEILFIRSVHASSTPKSSVSPVMLQTQALPTDSSLHFCVHLFVSCLKFDQTLPHFVTVASFCSEGSKYNTRF